MYARPEIETDFRLKLKIVKCKPFHAKTKFKEMFKEGSKHTFLQKL